MPESDVPSHVPAVEEESTPSANAKPTRRTRNTRQPVIEVVYVPTRFEPYDEKVIYGILADWILNDIEKEMKKKVSPEACFIISCILNIEYSIVRNENLWSPITPSGVSSFASQERLPRFRSLALHESCRWLGVPRLHRCHPDVRKHQSDGDSQNNHGYHVSRR